MEQLPSCDELPSIPGLPDPLVLRNGRRVATKEEWFSLRVPELRTLFQHYMYGYFPPPPETISSRILFEDACFLGGSATLKEVEIRFHPAAPCLRLLIGVPHKRQKDGCPVFVGPNFGGNHAEVPHPAVALPDVWMRSDIPGVVDHRATDAGRGKHPRFFFEKVIARGYAVATFYHGDLDPDKDDFTDGVHPHFAQRKERGPHDWGAIAAWAYGVMRAVDCLVTDPAVNPKRIAAVGHSRLGKTVLLAAAFDERISLVIPHQAGMGGSAPSRGTVGESVRQINDRFPHWFCGEFKRFNQHPEKLPFDQHCLVGLCAPRPVLFSNATEDTWANPAGQFDVLRAAVPVYELCGVSGIEAQKMPEPGTLISSRLGYFLRTGTHSMTPADWDAFLSFADRWL